MFSDNGKIACYQCKEGFILEENSQKCLKLSEKREIQEFVNCQRVSLNKDNNYSCSKCLDNYNLLRGKNESRCVNKEFIVTPKPEILNYCKDLINLGTEDKPWHSCNKCIENDILTQEQREKGITITKITYSEMGHLFVIFLVVIQY